MAKVGEGRATKNPVLSMQARKQIFQTAVTVKLDLWMDPMYERAKLRFALIMLGERFALHCLGTKMPL